MILRPDNLSKDFFYTSVIASAPGKGLIVSLNKSMENTLTLVEKMEESWGDYKYAEGKWTIKQVLKHISDSERVHSYRALVFSRNDQTVLPAFDEDYFALSDNTGELSLEQIKNEYKAVRISTIELFKTINEKALDNKGVGNGFVFTPRIIGWLISGHNGHHCRVVEEKYLPNIQSKLA